MPSSVEAPVSAVRRLIRLALGDPAKFAALRPADMDLAIRLMRRAQLLSRLGWRVREAGLLESLPPPARDALVGALNYAESQTRLVLWELERVEWALRNDPDIRLITMKGCAYRLAGLPNAGGRLFADLDLLVSEADLPRVEERLRAHGWLSPELRPYDEKYYRLWTHELPPMRHVERDVEVDLHHNMLMRTARLRPDARRLLERARFEQRTGVLAPTDMVLHAMTHLFFGSDFHDDLRGLVDIDEMLRHFGATEPGFWDELCPRAMQLDLARPLYYGLRYAARLLGTAVPPSVLKAADAFAPPALVIGLMDALVPRALFPQHPEAASRLGSLARLCLYIRSHWVRMPPILLVRHLAAKSWFRARSPHRAGGETPA